jgi:Transposase DNA-binding/Transposase DDE domain
MDSWIEEETRSVNLGDPRLRRRLQRLLARFSAQPEGSVPLACPGSAEMHGAYRFSQNKAVTPALLLGGHQAATLARMSACVRVVCVGDTTFLNYPKQRSITGLGPHSNPTEHGLLLHPLVAFSPEGVCLGTLHWQSWARDPAFGKRKGHAALPIEQKESRRWGEQLRSLDQWRAMLPDTQLLYVADRESDIYELLSQPREPGVDLLIRSVGRRKTEDGLDLRAQARTWPLPEGGLDELPVAARPGRSARTARVELRFGEVRLRAPWRRDRVLPEVVLRMVWVREPAPSDGAEPLEWMLLTSLPVDDVAAAWEVVACYRQRWAIERFFYVLKQGCLVESLQLQTRARLDVAIAVYLIVTYRILSLQGLAKARPDAPASVVFSPAECAVLERMATPPPPGTTLSLREATRRLAKLGGYTARASDGPPGPKTIWLGWQRLGDY